ncbi:MAG TPA: hypothetical protein VF070_08650, partial [Streptosporangiaceae bacterium]
LCLPGWPLLSGDAAISVVDYRLVVSFPHYSPDNQPQGGKSPYELSNQCLVNPHMTGDTGASARADRINQQDQAGWTQPDKTAR